jgi:hypothetical protein
MARRLACANFIVPTLSRPRILVSTKRTGADGIESRSPLTATWQFHRDGR